MKFVRTLTVPAPVERVFAYLSDFTTTNQWDPATVRTELIEGAGGVGTRYRNVSRFMGREAEVMYVVTELDPGRRFALRCENGALVAHDDMTVQGEGSRTTVTYSATFELKGLRKIASIVVAPALRRQGRAPGLGARGRPKRSRRAADARPRRRREPRRAGRPDGRRARRAALRERGPGTGAERRASGPRGGSDRAVLGHRPE